MSYLNSSNRFKPAAYGRLAPGYVYGTPAQAAAASAPAPSSSSSGGAFDWFGGLFGGSGSSAPSTPPAPTSSGWDKVWGTIKDIAAAGGKTAEEYLKAKGRDEAYREALAVQQSRGGMPSWMLPAMIGGGVLLAVLLLRRK